MKFTAPEALSLLDMLTKLCPDSSKTTLRSWLKEGRVLVDGIVQKNGSQLVEKGQTIAIGSKQRFVNEKIRILFEDEHLVVIEKPEGMLSVSTAFDKSKTAHALLKSYYRPKQVHVVHRLDQDTSGVMLFALSEKARDLLKIMFEKHDIEREYAAIVEGHLKESSGTWESYLFEDPNYVVHETADPSKGRLAITHYEVRTATKKYSWLNLKLETGRKNQIRVHCQKSGHSVVGDKKYGAASNPIKRLCLHAYLLAFTHPISHKKLRFSSPIPDEFYQVIPKKV